MTTEWVASTYDQIANPQAKWGRKVIDGLELPEGARVLDAGCGTGRVTEMVLEAHPSISVVALDGSKNMLDVASERLKRFAGRTDFIHADLGRPLPEMGGFDAIISTATFHWIVDQAEMFKQLAVVANQGAVLRAQWGGVGNIRNVTAILDEQGVDWQQYKHFPTVEETRANLEAAGWDVEACWLEEVPTTFEGAEAIEEWARTVMIPAELEAMSKEDGDRVVQAIVDGIPDYTVQYVRINVQATLRDGFGR